MKKHYVLVYVDKPIDAKTTETQIAILVQNFERNLNTVGLKSEDGLKDDEFVSGLHRQFAAVVEYITDTVLVSAFDIHHG